MAEPKTALTKAYEKINELNLDPNKVCSHQGKTMTILEVAHQMFLDKEAFEFREVEKSDRDRSS